MGSDMNTLTGEQRKQLIEEIIQQHTDGEITLGMAVRRLRLEVTGFDQETFAHMCGISTRALYQLETDKANPTLRTVESILRKFGLRIGLMSTQPTGKLRTAALNAPEIATRSVSRGTKPNRK